MPTKKWYNPRVRSGWRKDMTPIGRRRKALIAHKGDYLSAGRSLLALSNVTRDSETRRKARQDADYFFNKHAKVKK